MTRPKRIFLGALALVLQTACSEPASEVVPEPVATVEVAPAIRHDLELSVSGYGSIEFDPARQKVLSTEIESRVAQVATQPGANVSAGTTLLRLVPSSASSLELNRAQADATAAEAELARQQRLRADGLASDADVERARVAARDLTAQAGTIGQNVGAIREIRAPQDGVVDAVLVSPGDVVTPGSPLVRLSAPDAIQARINLELEDATHVSQGASVRVTGLDGGAHEADGRISEVDMRIDPQSRMASVIVPIAPGNGFLSGEAVRAAVIAEVLPGVLVVPRTAIDTDELGSYVFVAENGFALQMRVELGETDGSQTEIVSGIREGDLVIIQGGSILSDGMKLNIETADQPGAQQ